MADDRLADPPAPMRRRILLALEDAQHERSRRRLKATYLLIEDEAAAAQIAPWVE